MGGKKKPTAAQPRTKNNLKPSSSDKAAQFLVQHTGGLGLPGQDVSASALGSSVLSAINNACELKTEVKVAGFVPIPQDPDASHIDPRLLNILKRLDKRDSTTKQKALKEFVDLLKAPVNEEQTDFVETTSVCVILPYWPRIYSRMSIDADKRVRELNQQAMWTLSSRVGRDLAPYIKEIFPVWSFATVDFHEPVSCLATKGLSDTFPGSKLPNAYRLCARQLIDLVETKFSEILGQFLPFPSDQLDERIKDVKAPSRSMSLKGEGKGSLDLIPNELDAVGREPLEKSPIVRLSTTIRFLSILIRQLSDLPDDNKYIQRVRTLLSPKLLWSAITNYLNSQSAQQPSTDSRSVTSNGFLVYSSLYELCITLFETWVDWLCSTDDGKRLATYLCICTVGHLGSADSSTKSTQNDATLFSPPLTFIGSSSCYAQCWEAALSCLTNFSSEFIWSVVDWSTCFVPQLELLMMSFGSIDIRQVYSNLLNLLSKFLINYDEISKEQEHILSYLFVDTALKGIEQSLISKPPNKACSTVHSASPSVHSDPGTAVVVVSGILECSRFLIDRLLRGIPEPLDSIDDLRKQSPLVFRILDEIILRLLSDALDVVQPENSSKVRLLCTEPPLYRQAYLNAVFSQIARLYGHLARSNNKAEQKIFLLLRAQLIQWISAEFSQLNEDSAENTDPYRLGYLDPLRLIYFIDFLAEQGHSGIDHAALSVGNKPSNNYPGANHNMPLVEADWCVQLFEEIGQLLCTKLQPHRSGTYSALTSFTYLTYLCVYGHLSREHFPPIPAFPSKLFSVIVPGLSHDMHWPLAAIRGVAYAWSSSSDEDPHESPLPCTNVSFEFLSNLFPGLVQKLTPDCFEMIGPGLSNLCAYWIQSWIDQLLQNNMSNNSVDSYAILSNMYVMLTALNSATECQLRQHTMAVVLQSLLPYLPRDSANVFQVLSFRQIITLGSILVMIMNTITRKTTDKQSEWVDEIAVNLLKILLVLYSLELFGRVAVLNHPNSELALFLTQSASGNKTANSRSDHESELPLSFFLNVPELIIHAEQICLESLGSTSNRVDEGSKKRALIFFTVICTHVQFSAYIPPRLIQFAKRIHSIFTAEVTFRQNLSHNWLCHLADQVARFANHLALEHGDQNNFQIPPRHLLPAFGLSSMSAMPQLSQIIRLYQFGIDLDLFCSLQSNHLDWHQYIRCLGLLRAWVCSLPEPWDLCTEVGLSSQTSLSDCNGPADSEQLIQFNHSLDPAKSALGKTAAVLESKLGAHWHINVSDFQLSELIDLMQSPFVPSNESHVDDRTRCVLDTGVSAVLLNRLRSIHPNLWPYQIQLAATCSDDTRLTNSSWSARHLSSSDGGEEAFAISFHRLCELYLPAGIVRRCLPRQELLGHLKCFSPESMNVESDNADYANHCENAARVIQVISSLVGVHTTVPVYVPTFMSMLFEDYQSWLVKLSEASNEDAPESMKCQAGFYATIGSMMFFEALLLLWQPWQWFSGILNKSPLASHICMIQLSQRLRQLRPALSRTQWDFILCLTISWICMAVDSLRSATGNQNLFAYRAFRVAAAIGAIFVSRKCPPVNLNTLLIVPVLQQNETGKVGDNEWEDDLDAEAFEVNDDEFDNFDEYAEEENNKTNSDLTAEDASKVDVFNEDEEELEVAEPDEEDFDENALSQLDQELFIPRRAKPPLTICNDWENFFANHLYSSLLPSVLTRCLPIDGLNNEAKLNTPPSTQAVCAAFATCSSPQLTRVFTENPQLVLEYLMDLDSATCSSVAVKQIILSQSSSVNDFTPAFRASFDLACKLLVNSPYQSGQLLGHTLLSRLVCSRAKRTGCSNPVHVGNYLIHRLPSRWLTALQGQLPKELEKDLFSECAIHNWGRGSRCLFYLTTYSPRSGWSLNIEAHQSLLAYLLAWDGLLNLLGATGPQSRARLQKTLLGSSCAIFDRFMLSLGLLLPLPGNLESFINTPSRLEPDERLLLRNFSSRTDLIAALSLCSNTRQRARRPIRLTVPLASGDDRMWLDPFAPDDRLLYLPGHRLACDINHLAVRLFRRFLAEAPALIRNWFIRLNSSAAPSVNNTTDNSPDQTDLNTSGPESPLGSHKPGRLRQLGNEVEKLVSRHFSSGLARDEVVLVQYRAHLRMLDRDKGVSTSWFPLLNRAVGVGNVTIRSRPLSREVIATYQVSDDYSVGMLIQLPQNYPLGLATVRCERGLATSSQNLHAWTVQLSVFINNQNGSIFDGIDLWKQNVRKKFEGVEECAICYSVVHNTNFSLPKMKCNTCRKCFHYACMYRWFTTSRNPACPLCRQLFFGPTGRPVY